MKENKLLQTLSRWIVMTLLILNGCNKSSVNSSGSLQVIYNGNGNTGGTVPIDVKQYLEKSSVTVLGNSGGLTKLGFTFSSWNTNADGSGTNYPATVTFLIGTESVILYAQWTVVAIFTVTYDGNGNTGGTVPIDVKQYLEKSSVTVLGNSGGLTKLGFTFSSWNTNADGSGTNYAATVTFLIETGSVILYAQWTAVAPIQWNLRYVYEGWYHQENGIKKDSGWSHSEVSDIFRLLVTNTNLIQHALVVNHIVDPEDTCHKVYTTDLVLKNDTLQGFENTGSRPNGNGQEKWYTTVKFQNDTLFTTLFVEWIRPNGYYSWVKMDEIYTKYDGEFPPKEWLDLKKCTNEDLLLRGLW